MTRRPTPSRAPLTGTRIRDRRLALGLKQAELAEAAGISPSYINLIEHNKRRIGGKLVHDLARALQVEPQRLTEGLDPVLDARLMQAAEMAEARFGPAPEQSAREELAGRFPGWTGLVAEQQARIQSLEAQVAGLRDRLSHDPVLSETMHEVLSTVAAIRSTSDILVRDPDLDANWRTRFHRNLHEEAERLSRTATNLLAHFDAQNRAARAPVSPQDQVEAVFEAHGYHFPEIEVGGAGAIAPLLAGLSGPNEEEARSLAHRLLTRYAGDAARLPLETFLIAAREADFDPAVLLHLAGSDTALVLRRLASLPEGSAPGFGLAISDASGGVLFRRQIEGLSIPRFGVGGPRWPLARVLLRPMQPEISEIEAPGGRRFRAWCVGQPVGVTRFGEMPEIEATMLLRAVEA